MKTDEPRLLRALPDADLLGLVASGDLDAFAVIYDRHAAATWRVALHYSDDPADAEQAVAEVFLGLWREPGIGRARLTWRLRAEVTRASRGIGRGSLAVEQEPRSRRFSKRANPLRLLL